MSDFDILKYIFDKTLLFLESCTIYNINLFQFLMTILFTYVVINLLKNAAGLLSFGSSKDGGNKDE